MIYIFILLMVVAAAVALYTLDTDPSQAGVCTQDCNQGHNCTCVQESWPFPKARP